MVAQGIHGTNHNGIYFMYEKSAMKSKKNNLHTRRRLVSPKSEDYMRSFGFLAVLPVFSQYAT